MSEWLSMEDVGEELGIGVKTVYRLINRGELVAYRIARNYRVRPADVVAYLESARVKPGEMDHLIPDYDAPRHIDLRAVEAS